MYLPKPPENKKTIPVVFSCDERFLPYCAVAIGSLLSYAAAAQHYEIFILHTETFEKKDIERLETMCNSRPNAELHFLNILPLIKKFGTHCFLRENYSPSSYYRLLLPHIFAHYDKIVYLDSDVLLCADIASLFNYPLQSKRVLAAVPDAMPYCGGEEERTFFARYLQHLNIADPFAYFNAGILLWDLAAYRTHFKPEALLQRWKEIKTPLFMDQDILNAQLQGYVDFLPQTFNFFPQKPNICTPADTPAAQNYLQARQKAQKQPAIIHFAGFEKPWFYPDMPLANAWWTQAQNTPFYKEINHFLHRHDRLMQLRWRWRGAYWLKYMFYRVLNKLLGGRSFAAAQAARCHERMQLNEKWARRRLKK